MNHPERESLSNVEVIEGRYYLDGEEISETRAKELLGADFPTEPSAAAPEPVEEATNGVAEGDSVMERLRAGYKAGQGDRRKTLEIAPARYHDLAAEFKPIDWDLRRKLARIAERRGEAGHEADLRINSALMADACVQMMFRPAAGEEYAPLHTQIERYAGGDPIRFDDRLAAILGIELIGGESEGDICRLVFGESGIFEAHYLMLNGWSLNAFGDGAEDEEDEGGGRPT